MLMDMTVNFNLWIAFVFATAVLAMIPGPIVTLVIANSLAQGTRAGIANVIGTMFGNIVLFMIGGLGLAWILGELAHWFDFLRWAGAAYLVYLGIRQWRAAPVALGDQKAGKPGHSLLLQGFVVAVTNPKTMIFFAAFFPQFMDPTLSVSGQLIVLSATFLVVAGSLDTLYAVLAGRLRPLLIGERRGHVRNRLTGVLLMGTGAALALARR